MWFLPDNSDAIGRIKSLIRSAKKTIRVAMFTWTRTDLAQEVINASKRGIDVKVAIDYSSSKGTSAKIAKLLKENNIPVYISRGGPLLHHKFLYIDSSTLVNGSANWTKRAFTENDDCFMVFNRLNSPQVKMMNKLWDNIESDGVLQTDPKEENNENWFDWIWENGTFGRVGSVSKKAHDWSHYRPQPAPQKNYTGSACRC
jgi:phosphatidylserine/phosphatidylglycerophosphate/cardiolipin synthase-like enzyme